MLFIQIILIIVGFVLLIKGADVLVEGAESIAKRLHIPEIIIGLTIVSIGTSMPELFVSIQSATKGLSDIAIGNVIGSNICNLLLILGLAAIIKPIKFQKNTKKIEIPLLLIITIMLLVLSNINLEISRIDSGILLLGLIIFISYTIFIAKKGTEIYTEEQKIEETKTQEEKAKTKTEEPKELIKKEELKKQNIKLNIKSSIYIIIGIIGLKIGGDLIVNNATLIATAIGLSEKIIGLTIISIGTSLPEIVTTIVAAKKGETDLALGNVIGSNMFNILLILGVSGMITPINYLASYNIQFAILIIATIILLLFPYIGKKDEMTRKNGIIYILLYIMYMITVFILP